MLKNDGATVNALEKQYKATEKDIADLKHELGEVMGTNVRGKRGNQLLDDERWNGYAPEEDNRAPNMGGISPAGNAVKPRLNMSSGKPQFSVSDTPAHVAEDIALNGGASGNIAGSINDYISEKDFNTQLAGMEKQLGMRETLARGYDEQIRASSPNDPDYDLYQHGYSQNLNEASNIRDQIEALKKQREWSDKAELSGVSGNSMGFSSADAAAIAFLTNYQNSSQKQNKEYGVVIYEHDGRYYLGKTYVGTNGSVADIFVESVLKPSGLGKVVGTVHTHPTEYVAADTDSDNNSFSGMNMFLPGIRYLGAPNGTVYKNDSPYEKNEIAAMGLASIGQKDGGFVYSNQPLDTDLNLRYPVLMDILKVVSPTANRIIEDISDQIP